MIPLDAAAPALLTNKGRMVSIDRIRGLAVVLMILDHVCALYLLERPGSSLHLAIRLTVTRLSMPMFMLCAGAMLQRRGGVTVRRLVEVAGCAVVVTVALVLVPIGVSVPEILGIYVAVMVGQQFIVRYPIEAAVLGLIQSYALPIGWNGYQPGLVAACVALGVLSGTYGLRWGERLPTWLQTVGRRPLSWYCGHLAVLVGVGVLLGRAS